MAESVKNLGPAEARKRWLPGLIVLLPTLGAGFYLLATDQTMPWWGAALFFVGIAFGYLGVSQGFRRTCVMNAFRGTENFDEREVKVEEATREQLLRKKGRRILITSLVNAILLTFVFTYFSYV